MQTKKNTDAYGHALLDYWSGKRNARLKVYSDIADTETWEVSTFFRDHKDMPEAEQIALERVKGKTLDIGAGAGNHVLWLQEKGYDITGIDISAGAVEVMKKRGVHSAHEANFFHYTAEQYDTLLLLMNGIGIVGTLERLPEFFLHAKSLLKAGGKILMDSSNIIYLFMEEDGSALIDLNAAYYGELSYRMDYGKEKGEYFPWLFVDFDTLRDVAEQCGFKAERVYEDDHYLYLAELTLVD